MNKIKTYVVTYQSQGRTLREAKKNLRDLFEFEYGNSAKQIVDEMVAGLHLEKSTPNDVREDA